MACIEYLKNLKDVYIPAPADGDVLYWDAASSLWKAKAPPVGGGTIERLVRASTDDIFVYWNGSQWTAYVAYNLLAVGFQKYNHKMWGGGARFLNIYLAPGVTIKHAYLKVVAQSSDSLTGVKSRIHGEQNINPATFSNYANYDGRTRTTASIDWDDIASWTMATLYQSPDIKDIIQEIVNLDGWTSGNPIVIFWDDHEDRSTHINNTHRRGRSWDHTDRTPPMLYIEFGA